MIDSRVGGPIHDSRNREAIHDQREGWNLMLLTVETRRDALEALRAVEAWVHNPDACVTDERGEMLLRLKEAERWMRDHARDRRSR
jgi:hypothetical protein